MPWWGRAACRGLDVDRFDLHEQPTVERAPRLVEDHESRLAEARRVCWSCPVRAACLGDAMRSEGDDVAEVRFLVRGGLTPEQRHSLYRRGRVAGTPATRCPACGEAYDPRSLITGDLWCECGPSRAAAIPDRGDAWMDRHSDLYPRVLRDVLSIEVGARFPSPTEWARVHHVRKDDVIRVVRALVEDGVLVQGHGRGLYFRNQGKGASAWRPGPIRVTGPITTTAPPSPDGFTGTVTTAP